MLKKQFKLRPLNDEDREEYGIMLHSAFNTWYKNHGFQGDYFACTPDDAAIFYDIYNDLNPGCSVAVFDTETDKLAGACFYHPREHHMSLGIMSVHPDYFECGVGRLLVDAILEKLSDHKLSALRLVSSAVNMDSFSLYNRSGLVPRVSYNDMILSVPTTGLDVSVPGEDRVRSATLNDIDAIADLEFEISGITRRPDYQYAIENKRGYLHASVIENEAGGLDGFIISSQCPALNMIGPCFARSEEDALALVRCHLEHFRGQVPLFLIPMQKRHLVETFYSWGARNVETHLFQVRGDYKPYAGVNIPSYLPETG